MNSGRFRVARSSDRSLVLAATLLGWLACGAIPARGEPLAPPAAKKLSATTVSSQPANPLQAYLDAGEFSIALQLAHKTSDRDERDRQLQQIATAQLAAGGRQQASLTAGSMSDDLRRAAALQTMTPANSFAMSGKRGGTQADFDSLIELMTSTIAPTTWDAVGGPGSVAPFTGGVYVDATGLVKPIVREDRLGTLSGLRLAVLDENSAAEVRQASPLRHVSLPRLERHIQMLRAHGQSPGEEMQLLAGLEKIRYVLVYPETGDIVLAGPAGDWKQNDEGLRCQSRHRAPVLRLDDLVVVLRHMLSAPDARFGCSINPVPERLAATQTFLNESSKKPLKPGARAAWLKSLRDRMGQQEIEVFGIDLCMRVAQVLVEADYRMKLVGMGLERGPLGVQSYLEMVDASAEKLPPMEVLRWWFTLNYDAILATRDHDGFEICGPGAKVLSENELLSAVGGRVHTGESNPLNAEFAHSFTAHFAALAAKYPIYAELQNIFDMALVGALLRTEALPDRVDWHLTCFGDPRQYVVPLGVAPRNVETVINHRVIHETTILAGVSGGVRVDPWSYVQPAALKVDSYGKLNVERSAGKPIAPAHERWWWDGVVGAAGK